MTMNDTSRVLDEISREHIRPNLNLLPRVLSNVERDRQAARTARLRFAALLVVIVVLAGLFSQPAVAGALKKLVGFIPGIGSVEQGAPLRVLAAPVTETRDGFTLTVESAVLDTTRTVLNYRFEGPFPTWEDPSRKPATCQEYPLLRLENGGELTYPSSEGTSGGGQSSWQAIFKAFPPDQASAVLFFACLPDLPAGEGPLNWEIPLAFVPAPSEMTVYPVVELPTPTPAAPGASTAAPASQDDMRLVIERAAAVDGGYYLQSVLSWQPDPRFFQLQLFPDSLRVLDQAGAEVPSWTADQMTPFALVTDQSLNINVQTGPVPTAGPLTLELKYVGMTMAAGTRFTLDVGDNPQPGQTWQVGQELDVNGYRLKVTSAEFIQAAPGEPAMLMLYLEAGPEVLMVTAFDPEHEIAGTGGSPKSEFVPFRAGWYYKDGFPEGVITIEITTLTVRRDGPWSASWTP